MNLINNSQKTPLIIATQKHRTDIIDTLLDHNADVTLSSSPHKNLLFKSASIDNKTIFKELVKLADDNVILNTFHSSIEEGCLSATESLQDYVKDINKVDCCGDTALHLACKNTTTKERRKILSFLIEKGSDINKKNKKGKTPLSIYLQGIMKSSHTIYEKLIDNKLTLSLMRDKNDHVTLRKHVFEKLNELTQKARYHFDDRMFLPKIVKLFLQHYHANLLDFDEDMNTDDQSEFIKIYQHWVQSKADGSETAIDDITSTQSPDDDYPADPAVGAKP